jgi:hypothetical protein
MVFQLRPPLGLGVQIIGFVKHLLSHGQWRSSLADGRQVLDFMRKFGRLLLKWHSLSSELPSYSAKANTTATGPGGGAGAGPVLERGMQSVGCRRYADAAWDWLGSVPGCLDAARASLSL